MNLGRLIAIVPAHNEEGAVGSVIDDIRAFDPSIDVLVVDDASVDQTALVAEQRGASVVRLVTNLGIGGAVQTGFKFALEHGYDTAVRLDGDGQHDPGDIARLLEPLERGDADVVTGSRFLDGAKRYRPPLARRLGITWFARLVSLLTRQRVTDTTSGFQAFNRTGITLLAHDYPTDYPEVEATLLVLRHRLRLVEVPVRMREREHGVSSITFVRSVYYMLKVTLALGVAMLRKVTLPEEENDRS
ncbi:MAG TPA: glycosyltransferase family 2 protein [Gaiella sp.]